MGSFPAAVIALVPPNPASPVPLPPGHLGYGGTIYRITEPNGASVAVVASVIAHYAQSLRWTSWRVHSGAHVGSLLCLAPPPMSSMLTQPLPYAGVDERTSAQQTQTRQIGKTCPSLER